MIAGLAALGLVVAVSGCSSTSATAAPWMLIQSSPAASTVVVQYFHGDCDRLLGGKVKSTSESVRITLSIKNTAVSTCDDEGLATMVRVRLGSPLGTRTVEGACDPHGATCQPTPGIRVAAHLLTVGP